MSKKRQKIKFTIDHCQGLSLWIFFDSMRVWSMVQTKCLIDEFIQSFRLEASVKINDSS